MGTIRIVLGDITKIKVDAIVNAANNSLLGGGGVDGAIHRAAGPELLDECRELNGCNTGDAKSTLGYKLPAKYVIHTVGPVWHGGNNGEPELLKDCYISVFREIRKLNVKTLAFPAISTGAYGYPIDAACKIALDTVKELLMSNEFIKIVYFVAFNDKIYNSYVKYLKEK